ncbi:MAG: glycosyltransferase family 2 protein [Ilumatobacteraceae bacterium]
MSVVIPTFNRLDQLRRTLDGLAAQVELDHELQVVVVSDGSTDGTDEYLASGSAPLPLVVGLQPNGGPAVARNHGVSLATNDYVLFIDDDVVPAPELVAAHMRRHARSETDAVVIGPMLTPQDEPLSAWVRWEQDMLYKQYAAMERGDYAPTARQFYTGNASVARRHLDAVGGFDASFRRAEDVELAYRLDDRGLHFTFAPEAVVVHHAERSYDAWRQAATAYGRNDVIFSRDHGREWLMGKICHEFHDRHRLVRVLTRACLPRPRTSAVVDASLSGLVKVSDRLGTSSITRPALSAVYNLAYYRGMADELGDPRQLLADFAAARPTPLT